MNRADPIPRPLCNEDRRLFQARMDRNYARVNGETSGAIFRRHLRRWPELLVGGAVGAAVMLALTGWL